MNGSYTTTKIRVAPFPPPFPPFPARTQESKASEQTHAEYLTRLEDPMDPLHLL